MKTREVNFDGLVGPTHHYGGLAPGNLASQKHRRQTSRPRDAALEGLRKMKRLADLGIPQAVLPPHERPDLAFLREHGFSGTDAEVVQSSLRTDPDLLSIASSASAMWAANAATVSPSSDTDDGRVHLTPANLISTVHRRREPAFTTTLFRMIFADRDHFAVHDPLPEDPAFADEGAANHARLCREHGTPGVELFIFGRDEAGSTTHRYPARQTRTASEAIAHRHGLSADRTVFLRQNPAAIDAGVFHNDVIAVANETVLFCHEQAYINQRQTLNQLAERFPELQPIEVTSDELTVEDAVRTYLFNSQLVSLPDRRMLLLCPSECEEYSATRTVLDRVVDPRGPITDVRFVDVRQSMQNGGGPACLRLRIVLTDMELAAVHQPILFTEELFRRLSDWISRHYREELTIESLGDPLLVDEVRAALDELSQILELGAIYPFQQ